ncbi:LLM class flavin-dependent oxidoreductase [Actinokineospora bangkokensis]|uniref:Alkanal monooxygenase n=1 Tax=Actinokineospora bangkokensis TaxID=1193682 RepID=A0A1Q9LHE4_9PSEU|nr:LLM class flavin-dependent oxidoreductase [Actinokineospora bangkokensis]OLR91461.1 alkanal monooxygenase [Actinokineospora bangkokensis]
MSTPFSVLDLAPVASGATETEALRNSLDLARTTERLGYHRYWVAEHHNMPGIASSAPAVLLGHIGMATERIRIGSGGVMLPNHAPLVVAEQFGMLEAFHPGRVDLGIGRAPGTDQVTARALRRTTGPLSADDFPQQLTELANYFTGRDSQGVTAVPALGNQPAIWLLGSSGYSAQVAGLLGLPFAFAHHFSSENTLPALALYRERFRPSAVLDEPYAMIAANVLCADDDETARELAKPALLQFLKLRKGDPGKLPSPAEAAAYDYTDIDRLFLEERLDGQVVGGPETVRRGVEDLIASTGVDELMITTSVYDHADRIRSYEHIAKLFDLSAR